MSPFASKITGARRADRTGQGGDHRHRAPEPRPLSVRICATSGCTFRTTATNCRSSAAADEPEPVAGSRSETVLVLPPQPATTSTTTATRPNERMNESSASPRIPRPYARGHGRTSDRSRILAPGNHPIPARLMSRHHRHAALAPPRRPAQGVPLPARPHDSSTRADRSPPVLRLGRVQGSRRSARVFERGQKRARRSLGKRRHDVNLHHRHPHSCEDLGGLARGDDGSRSGRLARTLQQDDRPRDKVTALERQTDGLPALRTELIEAIRPQLSRRLLDFSRLLKRDQEILPPFACAEDPASDASVNSGTPRKSGPVGTGGTVRSRWLRSSSLSGYESGTI